MADAAQAAEEAREAQANLMVRNDLSKLPMWFGIPSKDTLKARQWVERVERAIAATGWTDAQAMSFVAGALRGPALEWYDILGRVGVDKNVWAQVRARFLRSYDSARTARTAVVNIFDVKQDSNETITDYHTKVCKAINDMEALLPAAARAPNPDHYDARLRALPAFVAMEADAKAKMAPTPPLN